MSSSAPNSSSDNNHADWRTVEPLGVYKPLTTRSGQSSRSPFIQPLGKRSLAILQPKWFSSEVIGASQLGDEFGLDEMNASPHDIDSVKAETRPLERIAAVEEAIASPHALPPGETIASVPTTATPQPTPIQRQPSASQPRANSISPAAEPESPQATTPTTPATSPKTSSPGEPSVTETVPRQEIAKSTPLAPSTAIGSRSSTLGAAPESRVFAPPETFSASAPAPANRPRTSTETTLANSAPPPLQRQTITPSSPGTESTPSTEPASVQASEATQAAIPSPLAAESVQSQVTLENSQVASPSLDTSLAEDTSPAEDSPVAASLPEVIQAATSAPSLSEPNASPSLPTSIAPLENSPVEPQPIAQSLDEDAAEPIDQPNNIPTAVVQNAVVQDAVVQRASDQGSTVSNERSAGTPSTPVTIANQSSTPPSGNQSGTVSNAFRTEAVEAVAAPDMTLDESPVDAIAPLSAQEDASTQEDRNAAPPTTSSLANLTTSLANLTTSLAHLTSSNPGIQSTPTLAPSPSGAPESDNSLSSAAPLQRTTDVVTNAPAAIAETSVSNSTNSHTHTPASDFKGLVSSPTTPTIQRQTTPETSPPESPPIALPSPEVSLQSSDTPETSPSTPVPETISPTAISAGPIFDPPPSQQQTVNPETTTPASLRADIDRSDTPLQAKIDSKTASPVAPTEVPIAPSTDQLSLQRRGSPEANVSESPQTAIARSDVVSQQRTTSATAAPQSVSEVPIAPSTALPLQRQVSPEVNVSESPQTVIAISEVVSQQGTNTAIPAETTVPTSVSDVPIAPSPALPLQRQVSPKVNASESPQPAIARYDVVSQQGTTAAMTTGTAASPSVSEGPISPATERPLQRTASSEINPPKPREQRPEKARDLAESRQPSFPIERETPAAETPIALAGSSSTFSAGEAGGTEEAVAAQYIASEEVKDKSLASGPSTPATLSSAPAAASVNTAASDLAVERPFLSDNRTVQQAIALPQVTQDLGVFVPLRSPLELNAPAETSTTATERITSSPPLHTPSAAAAINQTAPNSGPAWSLEDLVQPTPTMVTPEVSDQAAIQRQETATDMEHGEGRDRAIPTPPNQPSTNPSPVPSKPPTSSPEAWNSIADLLEQSGDAINRAATSSSTPPAFPASDAIYRAATSSSTSTSASPAPDTPNRAATASPRTVVPANATPDPFPNLHALDTSPPPIQRQTSSSQFTRPSSAMPIQKLAADEGLASTASYETVSGAGDDPSGGDASGQLEKLAQVMYQKVCQRLAIERERIGRSGSGRF